jgi:hypothetical protein
VPDNAADVAADRVRRAAADLADASRALAETGPHVDVMSTVHTIGQLLGQLHHHAASWERNCGGGIDQLAADDGITLRTAERRYPAGLTALPLIAALDALDGGDLDG